MPLAGRVVLVARQFLARLVVERVDAGRHSAFEVALAPAVWKVLTPTVVGRLVFAVWVRVVLTVPIFVTADVADTVRTPARLFLVPVLRLVTPFRR